VARKGSKNRRKRRRDALRKRLGELVGMNHVVSVEQGRQSIYDVLSSNVVLMPEERSAAVRLAEQLTGE